ncbi:myosin light chain kinase 2, skeletal/cardiac muscle [Chanos chanos]|uniref:Myosin light chain kinase 2, skeletal/cardiac muscle n=1 Tax=Chanos chanos TaxID=29144 RepID=A0A6J2USS0_CHACN|nr:myosin light chain kinase family member 4-like [Chanos chanos]
MGSVRCPAPLPVDLCTLETKVNDLHRKLDLLLSQNTGGCPMCLTCAQHKRQQEATASQLSSQAKLLESLERKVLNIQTALETVLQDLEEKHSTDKVSIPLTVLQRRKSLPDEVYVHLDKTRNLNVTQHGHNVAYRKVKNQAERAGAVSANKLTAAGIQIKISPVPDKNTLAAKPQSPPKTCIKVIDDVPPQPAPFPHRFVSLRPNSLGDTYNIHTTEVLGGGRFGKVHRCTESKTGLRLAAKIISTRNVKEKEMVLNEIQVMNQLSHINILQLYDAFEVKNQVVLILEYVEGGELFERIVDESWSLTEVDAMVFVRQICEGIHYMHQMYVLHLDLKPENILCVSRTGHQVKIIDFGLARRYKPREKLRVSFGTPEFLAPEVVNFDFVSFPTDMWTLGVVTYMLVSGLSPFLGDDDSQTLNNVLMVNWYFDEDAFEHVSAEAKDFISNLLIRERSGRLSAAQCLKHPWLNNISEKAKKSNIVLKSQVLLKKYMARKMWKKNYIAIAAANRFKRLGSSGSLTSLAV